MLVFNYRELRHHAGEKLTCTYDTGAVVEGTLVECKPAEGEVLVAVMENTEIRDADGMVIEHHGQFSFVPNLQVKLETESIE